MEPTESQDACELFELSRDVFVYRQVLRDDTERYFCRNCFDAGTKSVLERQESVAIVKRVCPQCQAEFLEKKKPLSARAMSPWG